jgi:hypothetical protein
MNRHLTCLTYVALCCGCAGSGHGNKIIASTNPEGTPDPAATKQLDRQIAEDERLAARILSSFLVDKDNVLAGWAAVHGLRLGLQQDKTNQAKALRRCLEDPALDTLLKACCWRWAALLDEETLRQVPLPEEPTARVLAALALPPSSESGRSLTGLLAIQQNIESSAPTRLVAQTLASYAAGAAPFDDGPVLLAVAFLDARRAGWTNPQAPKASSLVAIELRSALSERMGRTLDWKTIDEEPATPAEPGQVAPRLVNPLITHPLEGLRAMAVSGEPSLRKEALRALASLVESPTAADLGAASACLRAEQPFVRLEAARTFLLLSIRAHAP